MKTGVLITIDPDQDQVIMRWQEASTEMRMTVAESLEIANLLLQGAMQLRPASEDPKAN